MQVKGNNNFAYMPNGLNLDIYCALSFMLFLMMMMMSDARIDGLKL